ncbi:MAG: SDR family NAD(P)-dependent oxidoreductase [Lachnospiraceae bacterium]|nr:SDR family NAD(P)-dependent oxidoreductase [Lachnospiraceae bacterium]
MKTVLVTGASRGIGAAIARTFASKGFHTVITCAHSEKALFDLKAELEQDFQAACTAIVCDMSDYPAVEQLFSKIPAPDILINNAGCSYFGLLSDMNPEDWQRVIGTNLNACFYTCKLAIPAMVQKKEGRILNISSVWGAAGASMEVAYSASKGAINAFTKALAKELAPSNIQVNALAPGLIDTAMNSHLTAEDLNALKAEIPADRCGTPEEIADLAWQVVHAPTYMTGQIITIDGGWT